MNAAETAEHATTAQNTTADLPPPEEVGSTRTTVGSMSIPKETLPDTSTEDRAPGAERGALIQLIDTAFRHHVTAGRTPRSLELGADLMKAALLDVMVLLDGHTEVGLGPGATGARSAPGHSAPRTEMAHPHGVRSHSDTVTTPTTTGPAR